MVFYHGSGSSHQSPRNKRVAQALQQAEFGTLLFDLLTPQEDALYKNRFDVDLLADRQARLKSKATGNRGRRDPFI